MGNKKEATECPVKEKVLANNMDSCPVKGGNIREEECPVKHQQSPSSPSSSASMFSSIYSFFSGNSQSAPPSVASQSNPTIAPTAATITPNSSSSGDRDGYNTAANDLVFGQQPQPDQSIPMSQKRTISTIPKVDKHTHFCWY